MLLENNFSHFQALIDCFSQKNFSYAIKLLNKKLFKSDKEDVAFYSQIDAKGKSLMHYFCQKNNGSKEAKTVYKTLQRFGLDQNHQDGKLNKPINYAILSKNFPFVLTLLKEHKIKQDYLNEDGHSLLSQFLTVNQDVLKGQIKSQNASSSNQSDSEED